MRLRIDTTGVEFRVAGAARPRKDWKDQDRQATLKDGRPLWTVRLIAFDTATTSMETIWVEVAGDEPKLIPNEVAAVQGLSYAPWVNKKNEIVRAFRADAITMDG